ncbi:MAG: ABC transporter permease [Xanthobacteraceae bacterium]|nr:ABC transporter permease [Xanthobacteraceae bacterium]QYK44134.1 MAG: ABC transporter permease [Xanthobacteraceae bacterium]
MNHVQLAARNLARRRVRSILTLLGVGFAVGSFITLYGLSRSVHENAQASLDERGAHLTIARRGSGELFGGTIPENLGPKFAVIQGVEAVTGELVSLAPVERNNHALVIGWPDDSFFWKNMPLQSGRIPNKGERKVAVLGDAVAAVLNKKVGDKIEMLESQFTIVGISRYASVINRNGVVVPLADLQELTFKDGIVTLFHVRLKQSDPAAIERARQEIQKAGNVSVSTTENALRNDRFVGLLRAVSATMAWVSLLMGVLMVLNTLLMAVLERTREIGIMSSIGWSQQRIMMALMIEGLILSILGSAVGVVLGIGGAKLLNAIPAIGNFISVDLTFGLVAMTVFAAILLGILGSIYPAWVATRQSPAAALEHT